MSWPDIDLFVGLGQDVEISPADGTVFDWSAFDDVKFTVPGLGIVKTKSVGAAELELTNGSKNIKVHILMADLPAGKVTGPYLYQPKVKKGTEWRDVAGTGVVMLRSPA